MDSYEHQYLMLVAELIGRFSETTSRFLDGLVLREESVPSTPSIEGAA